MVIGVNFDAQAVADEIMEKGGDSKGITKQGGEGSYIRKKVEEDFDARCARLEKWIKDVVRGRNH